MKKFLMAIAGSAVLVLGACGGGGEDDAGEAGGDGGGDTGGETYDAAAAEETYQANCAQCHGENLEGASGPALPGGNSQEDIVSMIENGGSGMPPNIVEGDEAENVAAWLADQ
ncbi:cytochrome c551 [Alteribacillus persepolensis]|uniref:Cytochrome c551 n=1 Tax=Alteribacillus persepolensis TaxID=568899 RepID=A0A1G8AH79_9BACI|nr:cytochrome c [Alteribacillus persepolensis]SDH20312.1 cytochrome c551 [Alteribacillus persepolensis]